MDNISELIICLLATLFAGMNSFIFYIILMKIKAKGERKETNKGL